MLWNENYNFQQFVNEIGKMIKYGIILIDTDGKIIASTDRSRIGQIHEGGKLIAQQKLERLIIEDDSSYKGTRQGIALPVILHDEIVGVIGITGDPRKVGEYGEIIRKITQMTLQEEQNKQRERVTHAIYENLIREWLTKVPRNYSDFISRARLLRIEIELDRRCIIFQLNAEADPSHNPGGITGEKDMTQAGDWLEACVKSEIKSWQDSVYLRQEARCIVLLSEQGMSSFDEFCHSIKARVEESASIKVAVGIGSVGNHIEEIQRSFYEAEQAAAVSLKQAGCAIRLFEEMDIEILFNSIPEDVKKAFVKRIMGTMPAEKYTRYMSLLEEMYQLNGSISLVASKMFVHKNTLQQWIIKLRDYTGYDPRIIREGMPLYIAMLFYKDLGGLSM